jgi:hypothetical protein
MLINKAEPEDLLPDVKYSYDNFINASINYFKTIDNNDLLQEEYKNLDESALENINAIPELGDDIGVEEADKLMMRSIKITTPTLDKYVKRKTAKPESLVIMPKQKEVNLMDPELKVKGIQGNSNNNNIIKKKNITNKYDEIINAKKENKEKLPLKICKVEHLLFQMVELSAPLWGPPLSILLKVQFWECMQSSTDQL